jgi:hypothetical protein
MLSAGLFTDLGMLGVVKSREMICQKNILY